jgi:tellurite resistance protein
LTDRFTAATVLLHVAAAVATANGTVTDEEERHLEEHLESSLHLDEPERARLRAHLQWLLSEHPSLAGMKKRLEVLTDAQRRQLGRFLIGVAGADGHVDRDELKVLGKLYPMLGLDPDSLYTDVHALTATGDGPVTVIGAAPGTVHTIPPPQQPADAAEGVTLSAAKVAAIMDETAAVAAALGAVFDDPDDLDAAAAPTDDPTLDDVEDGDGTVAGLDAAHSTLVVRLAERPMWPRAEFEELARRLGLMPAGAVETINEAAFSACDEPLLEGDDPIEVNTYAVEELLA